MAYDEKELDEGVNVAQQHYENTFGRQAGSGNTPSEDMLRDAETSGVSDDDVRSGARDFGSSAEQSQRRAEERAGFTTRVTGKPRNTKEALAKGGQILKRKRAKVLGNFAPIIAIVAALLGLGGGAIFGQMFMPFGLDAQIHDNFNSMRTSSTIRSKTFLKLQMDGVRVKDVVQAKMFGPDKFKISGRQEAKFKQNNIEVDRNYEINGKKTTVLKHTDSTGKVSIAVADDSLAGGNIFHIDDLYNNDVSFRNDYFNGAKTWRGAIYQWYDTKTGKLFEKLKLTRDKWRGFKPKNENDLEGVKAKMESDTNIEGGMRDHSSDDGDGKQKKPSVDIGEEKVQTNSSMDVKTKRYELANKLKTRADNLAKGSQLTNLACIAADVIGAGSLILAGMVTMNVLQTAVPVFESIERAKIGDGDSSPINTFATQLATPAKSKYVDKYDYNDGNETYDTIEQEGSAMDAEAVSAAFGRHAINPNDPSVKSLSPLGRLNKVTNYIGLSKDAFRACTAAKIGGALIGLAGDALAVASCILGAIPTAGAACIGMLKDAAIGFVTSLGMSAIFGAIMSVFMPFLIDFFAKDLVTELVGEDFGNALISGGNIINGRNHRFGGGSVADADSLLAYSIYNERVIADNARHDRETRSPFDITTPNTFMGSIANKLIPVTFNRNQFGGALAAMSQVASNSVQDLFPTSYAMEVTNMVTETAKHTAESCPYLESIGAVGDPFCNEYNITDVSTMDEVPGDVIENLVASGQLEDKEGDVPVIKEDSELAEYLTYCGARSSPFGIADQNIAQSLDTSTGSNAGDQILGATPLVGDMVDIMDQADRARKLPYITGEACVTNNQVSTSEFDTPNWEEAKEFQRFIEDQRLSESSGLVEKSAVSVFYEKYYEEHPIDDSFEGILAQMSGLTKENVIATLDNIQYLAEVMNYDPIGRLPLQENEPLVEPIEQMKDEGSMEVPSMLGLFKQPLYFQGKFEFVAEA